MTIVERALPCLALSLLAAGCGGSPSMQRVLRPGDKVPLAIDGKQIQVELASDPDSRSVGLMKRKELPADEGMLFSWPERREGRLGRGEESGAQRRSFWMHNTLIPLSIAFISDDGKILQIEDMAPLDERKVWSKDEVRFALEMNQGWFQKNNIGPDAQFKDFKDQVGKVGAH